MYLPHVLDYYIGSTFKYTEHNNSRNGKNAPAQYTSQQM